MFLLIFISCIFLFYLPLDFVLLMFAGAIRFPDILNPQFCPKPDSKAKKSSEYVESKSVLGLRYSTSLHYTIAHLRRADGAFPPHSSGRKAMNLLDVKSPARFCCILIHVIQLICSYSFTTAIVADTLSGKTNHYTVGGFTTCGATSSGLSLKLFTRDSLSRPLQTSMRCLIATFACKS